MPALRSRLGGATPLAVLFALGGALALAAQFGRLPSIWGTIGAAPLLLGGAAAPLLLRWSPVEPSILKLGLLAGLLSTPLLTLARFAGGSWTWALILACGLQVLALGRPLRFDRPGRAAWGALGLGLATAVGLAWLLFGHGWALRLDGDAQVWHAAVAESLTRGWPGENPFLAGTPLPTHPGYAALIATVAEALGLPTASAAAVICVACAASLPLSLYLIAAPLWAEPRRVLAAPLLAVLAWTAFTAVGVQGQADPAWALGPAAPGLALAAGTWLAAVHGLRHGRRPWVGLTALLGGLTLLVAPVLGVATLLPVLLVAFLEPGVPAVRWSLPPLLLALALPGFWLVRVAGAQAVPGAEAVNWDGFRVLAFLALPLLGAGL
jgi:hypothetical protein